MERGLRLAGVSGGHGTPQQGADRLRRHRHPLRQRRHLASAPATRTRRPTRFPTRPSPEAAAPTATRASRRSSARSTSNPAINDGSASVGDVVTASRSPISSTSPASPASTGCSRSNTLGYVAQMQEAGVPVTFGYISDAHDGHGAAGEIHHAYGPGEQGYVDQLKAYDDAFDKFFAPDAERRDHEGQLALRRHRRGGRPLRGHRAGRPDVRRRHQGLHVRQCQRGQRRPEAARCDVQREPRHDRDDGLQRPQRPRAERLHHRQSGARDSEALATSRRPCRTSR